MLDLEALARCEHHALLQKKVYAEISGEHILLVVNKGGGSCNRSDVVNLRCGIYPVVKDLTVGIQYLSVSLDDLILMLKSQRCQLVVDGCAADGILVSSLTATVYDFRVL